MPSDRDDYKDLKTISKKGVEIFATGTYNGDTYTLDDLKSMVAAFNKVGFKPPVKAGHQDGQEDEKKARQVFGAPALGYVERIYIKGNKLVADIAKIPGKFADLINAGAYKRISAEIYWNYKDNSNGKKFPRVLKAISFLGAEIPALTNLKAIEDLYQLNDAGTLYAYDDNGEYRLYEHAVEQDYYLDSFGVSEFLTRYPRKTKQSVNYREVDGANVNDAEAEICSNCRYYMAGYSACSLVEGYIWPKFTSDLFEMRPSYFEDNGEENFAEDPETYIIRPHGDQWQLSSKRSGKTLGSHPSKRNAIEQERAIKDTELEHMVAALNELIEQGDLEVGDTDDRTDDADYAAFPAAVRGAIRWAKGLGYKSCAERLKDKPGITNPFALCRWLVQGGKTKKKNSDPQGGTHMAEKPTKTNDVDAEELEKKLEERETALKAEYDKKLEDAKKAIREETDQEKGEMTAQLATIQKERKNDKRDVWLDAMTKAGKLPPVMKEKVRVLYDALSERSEACKYTDTEGKEREEAAVEILKGIFEASKLNLFKELTHKDGDEPREADPDPGVEADKRAKEYAKENKLDITDPKQLQKAYSAVFKEDPNLAQAYSRMSKN